MWTSFLVGCLLVKSKFELQSPTGVTEVQNTIPKSLSRGRSSRILWLRTSIIRLLYQNQNLSHNISHMARFRCIPRSGFKPLHHHHHSRFSPSSPTAHQDRFSTFRSMTPTV